MATIPQTCTADHTLAVDQALRDAFAQLPLGSRRATSGLTLALTGHVTLHSPTEAHVTSARDPEVVYHVHSRGGCDCPDAHRRLEQRPDVAPGQRACTHWFAAVITAMAHLNLRLKGSVPEPSEEVWYPAVLTGESGCTWSGTATETAEDGWWFAFGDGEGGLYCAVQDLELWERTPCHVIAWHGQVSQWERWLAGR